MKRYCSLMLVLLSGCGPSIEELRSQPTDFVVTVSAPWDKVGACLARAYADDLQALYLPEPSRQRAELLVTLVVSGTLSDGRNNLFAVEIDGAGPTTVSYRQRRGMMAASWKRKAQENIERCGKA